MTHIIRLLFAALIAMTAAAPVHALQGRAPYTQAELDQMLAPIALYPDALLAQIFMAATRPREIVEAAHWVRANPGLQGDDAVRAVQQQSWDPSVQSLVAFPQLLARMEENLEWTEALGDAYFVQEPVVMETIQELRRRARAAGHLAPDNRLRVYDDGQAIVIEPASPQLVYVPYYDPWLVYGPWWWSAYPPVAWAPWPGYALVRRPGVTAGFWWGRGVAVSTGFLTGGVDWRHRRVRAPAHSHYSRPVTPHRDSAAPRRAAPEAVTPAPRIESRTPRAERPYPRRASGAEMTSSEPRRIEPRAPATLEPNPRFQQRAAETRQPAAAALTAPERIERAPRTEAQRVVPQTLPVQPRPQRAERLQQAQSQPAQAPHTPLPQSQAQHIEHAPRAVPQRAEPAPRRDVRDEREGLQRGIARP